MKNVINVYGKQVIVFAMEFFFYIIANFEKKLLLNVFFKIWENQENFVFNIFFGENYGDLIYCLNLCFGVPVALNALFMKQKYFFQIHFFEKHIQ